MAFILIYILMGQIVDSTPSSEGDNVSPHLKINVKSLILTFGTQPPPPQN